VRIGYENNSIPVARVSAEVWRAATQENTNLEGMISSELVFRCNEIVKNSKSAIDAYKQFNAEIIKSKANSLVTEFAKRAIVQSFNGAKDPAKSWRSNFVSELTDYFVSRDIAGFYGNKCRNKNISQLTFFRGEIKAAVGNKINEINTPITNLNDWKTFVGVSLDNLKKK
jgi:hypothetical protein